MQEEDAEEYRDNGQLQEFELMLMSAATAICSEQTLSQ